MLISRALGTPFGTTVPPPRGFGQRRLTSAKFGWVCLKIFDLGLVSTTAFSATTVLTARHRACLHATFAVFFECFLGTRGLTKHRTAPRPCGFWPTVLRSLGPRRRAWSGSTTGRHPPGRRVKHVEKSTVNAVFHPVNAVFQPEGSCFGSVVFSGSFW